jgi:phosphate starvation-inducible protein PhoH and related proteins
LILRHTFSPSNNTRLGHVCGAMDEHLRTIELGFDVKISHSHEKFRIDGHKAKVTRALEVLQALYERAAKPISKEHVQLMLVGDEHMGNHKDGSLSLTTRRNDVQARTPTQALYLENIAQHDITFGIGPAGTGKTYLAVASAVDALERSAVQRIILTRPAVEAGEKLGFLPGDLGQKVDPYLRPSTTRCMNSWALTKCKKPSSAVPWKLHHWLLCAGAP